tara:strand:- start:649 stop:1380 length:732 start_codon:yes stop_codon:yes gene_type:complete
MFDVDIGKFVSRSLGIGEESTDEAVRLGTSIATGNVAGAVIAGSQLLASEKQRSEQAQPAPSVTGEQPMYMQGPPGRSGQIRESGGYIDIPAPGAAPIYEGFVGQIPNILGQVFRSLPRGTGGLVGGAAAGAALSGLGGNACGCEPKPFVRFDKCDRPIITRKMKKQAIEMVNCSGAESAAATLTGGDANLLNMIISKQFPPMRKGISGRQLATAKRVNAALLRNTAKLGYKCTPMPSKMGVK